MPLDNIGISSTSDTNVGIGTAKFVSKLTVEGDALVSGMVTATGNFSGDLYGTADFAIDAHFNYSKNNYSCW